MSNLQLEPEEGGGTSHMMKNSRRGKPYLKDTLDLFATLIVSLNLTTHKQFFRSFPNSFTTDEAATNLASLKFSQSNRGPDPRNPNRIITTTTTTTFSMTRDMAKQIAQHFMDARLIENAADKSNPTFRDRTIFQITPKGLHILERFIAKNGITADNLVQVFATQPICMKLLHLERRASDDDIITTEPVILTAFRRFAGRTPNYPINSPEMALDPAAEYYQRAHGVPLQDIQERRGASAATVINVGGTVETVRNTFTALIALEWLCDFTTIVGRDEAAEMCSHFMRYKLIELVSDKTRNQDDLMTFTSRGPPSDNAYAEATFRVSPKAIYKITDQGKRVARWREVVINGAPMPDGQQDPVVARKEAAKRSAEQRARESNESGGHASASGSARSGSVGVRASATEVAYNTSANPNPMPQTITSISDAHVQRRASVAEYLGRGDAGGQQQAAANDRKSNTDRLKMILEEPALRHLFREFLRGNFSEENLSFWLDVQDFKRRFHTTSSAIANNVGSANQHQHQQQREQSMNPNAAYGQVPTATGTGAAGAGGPRNPNGTLKTPGQQAMAKHHESLVAMTFVIYNTYLAQGSACELNIDHALRNELFAYLNDVLVISQRPMTGAGAGAGAGTSGAGNGGAGGRAGEGQTTTTKTMLLKGRVEPDQANIFNASQLQAIIKIYERIQVHVFRLMATDSVPKFIKTQRFLALRSWVDDIDALDNEEFASSPSIPSPAVPPGLYPPPLLQQAHAPPQQSQLQVPPGHRGSDEVGRAYLTISQAANEKAQTKLKAARLLGHSANVSDTSLS